MKKRTVLLTVPVLAIFLAGCGNDDKVTDVPDNAPVEGTTANTQNQTNNTTTNNQGETSQTATNTTQTTNAAFNFTNFDLDVEYENNQEYDVDYDNEQNGMEAEIKDDRQNSQLKGDEAFAVLSPIFESLKFDKNTSDEEVISEVMNAFNLDENYKTFELEVKFTDGTEKEYKVTK
ncbi:YusW family protein [Ureibacillus manganicus]|uniref:YusW-like protein n=1 Tax=Ureibacillus manganicus DSM 26584 TaxID=1384049 RepID=A0A0A3HPN5_9BACL|nr:YusW family protein [Ureibacillus manganicus]KGR74334.1 hypothetical protein CD29_18615 [Ureibacillus manganicus DSM 26584]